MFVEDTSDEKEGKRFAYTILGNMQGFPVENFTIKNTKRFDIVHKAIKL